MAIQAADAGVQEALLRRIEVLRPVADEVKTAMAARLCSVYQQHGYPVTQVTVGAVDCWPRDDRIAALAQLLHSEPGTASVDTRRLWDMDDIPQYSRRTVRTMANLVMGYGFEFSCYGNDGEELEDGLVTYWFATHGPLMTQKELEALPDAFMEETYGEWLHPWVQERWGRYRE